MRGESIGIGILTEEFFICTICGKDKIINEFDYCPYCGAPTMNKDIIGLPYLKKLLKRYSFFDVEGQAAAEKMYHAIIVECQIKKLCDLGVCVSMAHARRIVTGGGFDKAMKRIEKGADK